MSGIGNAPFYEGTSPLVSDRYIISLTVGGSGLTITPGQVVEISTDWTVDIPAAANSKKVVGVALTGGVTGQIISIVCRGIVRCTSGGAINAGDQVTNSTNGTVITDNTDENTTIIGKALSTVSGSGMTVYILLSCSP